MSVLLTEEVKNKWASLLESKKYAPIVKPGMINQTLRLLENTDRALNEAGGVAADVQQYNPVLLSLVRRTAPSLVSNEIVGVQPMSTPTGLIFAQRVHYENGAGARTETWKDAAPDKTRSGAMATATGEALGANLVTASGTNPVAVNQTAPWTQMVMTIDKVSISAQTRALKSSFTNELAQDLKAVHGLDAEAELSAILSTEIMAEIDREIIGEINSEATLLASNYKYNGVAVNTATAGVCDLTTAGFDGRWTAEQYRQLLDVIDRQAQLIAVNTRRGKGNFVVCSANVASALESAGSIRYLAGDSGLGIVQPDVTGIAYVGILANRYKLFVDPYATSDYITVGYKGPTVYDAGLFYAPYVPLQMYKAVGADDFQPRIGFKTRYALASNPYALAYAGGVATGQLAAAGANPYFQTFAVNNL